ncbi:putative btb poz-like protein [Neofusicoccum parvum UCRNP2]|uniref:Putative btb poz-like protein n=1 Tax=Botryosphaeria parva (strain UCR-NP2) TaxID=1287680 RepID=R1E6V1_BOTPV|nr:putative btb poz-like protein [Neofusicoccum parvum UCRNP2]
MSSSSKDASNAPSLAPPQPARPGASRSESAQSVKSAVGHFTEAVRPSVSTRDSQAELPVPVHHLGVPARPPNTPRQPSSDNLRSGLAGPVTYKDRADTLIPGTAITELLAGQTGKAFKIHTDLLKSRSPYFAGLLSQPTTTPVSHTLAFPDLDEFAMALFVRWLYGASLHGPTDFHSMQHYLCLYILATRFGCERLKNEVMDHVRAYYRGANMTAPAYRLEYVFDSTSGPNHMRRFLVHTAAYRYLCEREPRLSDSMRGVVEKGGDLAVDFAEALAALHQSELGDVRIVEAYE